MLATLRRLRSLALWVIACVVVGPSALALCPDAEPVEVAPCHETGEDMGNMPTGHGEGPDGPTHHGGQETACLSACCVAPGDLVDPAVTAPVPVPAVVLHATEVRGPVVAQTATATAARTHPPPGPTLLDTGRLRI